MLWERHGFDRYHVENVLTTRQIDLYVHLAFGAIEREANMQATAIGKVAIEILNEAFKR